MGETASFSALMTEQFARNFSEIERRLELVDYNNNAFFLVSMSILIFLMQCGFAFLEAGSVRSKNTTNILIKNLLDSCISCISYWALGWGFAFGTPSNRFIGYGQFLLLNTPDTRYPFWFFQFVFAATASTIVSGALAERCEFVAYFAYCAFITAFAYPVITHWAWATNPEGESLGWLAMGVVYNGTRIRYKDFAGSGVVHLHGGTSAFIGALILGPRLGRFPSKGQPDSPILGHSVPFAALGGFILMFGFFAFNGGSQANISATGDGQTVARAIINTMLCGGWAALTALMVNRFVSKGWSLLLTINGALTGGVSLGMVTACAGCDVMEPWAMFFAGIGAGLIYMLVSFSMQKMHIDDPLDAVAVHAGGGFWGLIITPILMTNGIVFRWDAASFILLAWNVLGAGSIILWSLLTMGSLFSLLKVFGVFRVPPDVETKGLDLIKHNEAAYPVSAYGHGWHDMEPEIAIIPVPVEKEMELRSRMNSILPSTSSGKKEKDPRWRPSPRLVSSGETTVVAINDGRYMDSHFGSQSRSGSNSPYESNGDIQANESRRKHYGHQPAAYENPEMHQHYTKLHRVQSAEQRLSFEDKNFSLEKGSKKNGTLP